MIASTRESLYPKLQLVATSGGSSIHQELQAPPFTLERANCGKRLHPSQVDLSTDYATACDVPRIFRSSTPYDKAVMRKILTQVLYEYAAKHQNGDAGIATQFVQPRYKYIGDLERGHELEALRHLPYRKAQTERMVTHLMSSPGTYYIKPTLGAASRQILRCEVSLRTFSLQSADTDFARVAENHQSCSSPALLTALVTQMEYPLVENEMKGLSVDGYDAIEVRIGFEAIEEGRYLLAKSNDYTYCKLGRGVVANLCKGAEPFGIIPLLIRHYIANTSEEKPIDRAISTYQDLLRDSQILMDLYFAGFNQVFKGVKNLPRPENPALDLRPTVSGVGLAWIVNEIQYKPCNLMAMRRHAETEY